jgi:hypothetical protein
MCFQLFSLFNNAITVCKNKTHCLGWVVTGNHLTDNPYTGKSLISAINSLKKKYSSYSPDNDPWKKDSSYSPDNDPWKK